MGKGIEALEARDSFEPLVESVDFQSWSPSEIVSETETDFLKRLVEPPLDVLELRSPKKDYFSFFNDFNIKK